MATCENENCGRIIGINQNLIKFTDKKGNTKMLCFGCFVKVKK